MKRKKITAGRCMDCKRKNVIANFYDTFIVKCKKDGKPITEDEYHYEHECRNGGYRRRTKSKAHSYRRWKDYKATFKTNAERKG